MLTYGFFNSSGGDRKYTAEQMSDIFDQLLTPGVLETFGNKFFTIPQTSGLGVIVRTGWAWFDQTWTKLDADLPFQIDVPDLSLSRIDTVAIVTNKSELVRANHIEILKGIPSVVPTPAAYEETAAVHIHPIAYVTVRPDAEQITSSDIEILVGKAACPFITSVLQATDITTLFNAWDEQFQEWFEHIQSVLSEEVVTNLYAEIEKRVKIADKATTSEAQAGTNNTKWMTPALVKSAVENRMKTGWIEKSPGHINQMPYTENYNSIHYTSSNAGRGIVLTRPRTSTWSRLIIFDEDNLYTFVLDDSKYSGYLRLVYYGLPLLHEDLAMAYLSTTASPYVLVNVRTGTVIASDLKAVWVSSDKTFILCLSVTGVLTKRSYNGATLIKTYPTIAGLSSYGVYGGVCDPYGRFVAMDNSNVYLINPETQSVYTTAISGKGVSYTLYINGYFYIAANTYILRVSTSGTAEIRSISGMQINGYTSLNCRYYVHPPYIIDPTKAFSYTNPTEAQIAYDTLSGYSVLSYANDATNSPYLLIQNSATLTPYIYNCLTKSKEPILEMSTAKSTYSRYSSFPRGVADIPYINTSASVEKRPSLIIKGSVLV